MFITGFIATILMALLDFDPVMVEYMGLLACLLGVVELGESNLIKDEES